VLSCQRVSENGFRFPFHLTTRSFTAFGILNAAFNSLYLWHQSRKQSRRHFNNGLGSVFFAWLDDHCHYLPHQIVDTIFPISLVVFIFHPWYLRLELTNRVSFQYRFSINIKTLFISLGCMTKFLIGTEGALLVG